MNTIQHQMLRRIESEPRDLRYFTSTSSSIQFLSAKTVQSYLNGLVEYGYIKPLVFGYMITAAGLKFLKAQGQIVETARITNASSSGLYKPTELLVSNRPGANDALAIKSHGVRC